MKKNITIFQNKFLRTALLSLAFVLMSFTVSYAQEVSFKVTNNTKVVIKKLLVAEAGKKYKYFDIGTGIKPGQTIKLVWDKSAYNDNCEQYFKAVYADGTETEPAKFDFCEDELELVFDN
jgi:hypothetical protein